MVEGWFDETLTPERREQLALERVSLVTIDTDLYQPTRLVLEWIEPLLHIDSEIAFGVSRDSLGVERIVRLRFRR